MDRQLSRNVHQQQVKVSSSNDCLPSTSRQGNKSSRPNKQLANQSKNFLTRNQNNKQQPRSREPKYAVGHNFRDGFSRGYLESSTSKVSRKPNGNNGKFCFQERFVQANCQFVMSSNSDNSVHLIDPDEPIKWDMVEEVLFACASNKLNCAICLCYPTAAKITICGHVFCWTCILGWINVGEKDTNLCPLCFKTVKKTELKSVNIIEKIDYDTNDYLTFSLMKIRKNSTVALPVKCDSKDSLQNLSRNTNQTLDLFAKMFTATPDYVLSLIERERNELNKQLSEYESENMPEVCFVHNAFDELAKRQQHFDQINELCKQFACISLPQNSPRTPIDDYVYFYQSDDGQPIYLNSLNVRMLKREFGELRNCPLSISAKIVDLHGESVTEEIRRRNAHLRHLPLSREYKIAELAFDASIVSQATLDEFSLEINNRKKSKKRKEKAQKLRDRRIEIENRRKIYGISPDPTFQLDNVTDFPEYDNYSSEVVEPFLVDNAIVTANGPEFEPSLGSDTSFAKMLLTGGGHSFDHTLRKSKPTNSDQSQVERYTATADDDEVILQPMSITLGDFLDCNVKTSKKNKKGKKK